jgi:hypothetical protein
MVLLSQLFSATFFSDSIVMSVAVPLNLITILTSGGFGSAFAG